MDVWSLVEAGGFGDLQMQIKQTYTHVEYAAATHICDDVLICGQGVQSTCAAPGCYCIPKDNECFLRHYEIQPNLQKMKVPHGKHDFDYNLVLTVTNNAMLATVFTFKASYNA